MVWWDTSFYTKDSRELYFFTLCACRTSFYNLPYSIIFYKFLRICKNSSLKNCILLEKLRRLRADDRIEDRNQEHLFDLNKKRQPGSVVPKAAIKFPILTQINLHWEKFKFLRKLGIVTIKKITDWKAGYYHNLQRFPPYWVASYESSSTKTTPLRSAWFPPGALSDSTYRLYWR